MELRIIDANLNRLAEGLRVVEDICRFGLDDASIAARLKAFRHFVRRLRACFPAALLDARDSMGDVGRERVKEPAARADAVAVLGASLGRIAEALRVIEEMAKIPTGVSVTGKDGRAADNARAEAARLAKAMRYEAYELEKQIVPRFDRAARAARLRGLYLVMTDPAAGYERLARAAVRAGVAAIQLRAKGMDGGPLLDLARRLRELTTGTGTLFIINDRPDIARLAEADGVHLGQSDMGVADARAIVGGRVLIGKSTHNPKELRAALAEHPDYVGIGPVFGTRSKADAAPRLGLDRAKTMLAQARRAGVPAVAIGGIGMDNLSHLLSAGFECYALIGAVCRQKNPAPVLRALKQAEGAADSKADARD